jgi:hypothetical protein
MDNVVAHCLDQIGRIKRDVEALNTDREDALRFYRGDSDIVQTVEGRSTVTTSDLMDTVEWLKPALLEIFAGKNDCISLQPTDEMDAPAVKKLQLLIDYQLRVRNKWYLIMHDWISDALLMKIGVVKYQWVTSTQKIRKQYLGLSQEEYEAKAAEENAEVVGLIKHTEQPEVRDSVSLEVQQPEVSTYDMTVDYIIYDEYPEIDVVPPEDFGMPTMIRELDDAKFVYHRVSMPKWKFVERYGSDKLDEVKTGESTNPVDRVVNEQRFLDLGGKVFYYDQEKDEYIVYECYFRDDDGTPKVVHLCGMTVLEESENPYGRPPFVVWTPIKVSHRMMGLSFYDLLKNIQKLRTELLRQVIDNCYQTNYRRVAADVSRVNLDDLLNNNTTNAVIRVTGDPRAAIFPEQKAPLPAEVFGLLETLLSERDYHSGVPRSYQGVLPATQHRTFRGQSQQVELASQRIQHLARIIAEMAIAPLVNEIVNLNIMFLTKKRSIRYLNEWVEITPDNIVGKYDVAVNVGLGTRNKDNIVIQMQQLLGIFAQIFRLGVPVVNAQNVYNVLKEMLDAMGYKNASDFVSDPNFVGALKALLSAILPMSAQMPQLMPVVAQVAQLAGISPQELMRAPGVPSPEQMPGGAYEAPELPAQPAQGVNPVLQSTGRGFMP